MVKSDNKMSTVELLALGKKYSTSRLEYPIKRK